MLNKNIWDNHTKPILPKPTELNPQGRLPRPVKAILFDIYGTLFISASGDISAAQNSAENSKKLTALLQKYAVAESAKNVLYNFFAQIKKSHQKDKGVEFPEIKIDTIWSKVLNISDMRKIREFAVEYELIVNPVYPMPHLEELLRACQKSGVLMGIISNAQFYTKELFEYFLKKDIKTLGFNQNLTFFSYQQGCAKPSIKLFKDAALQLNNLGISTDSALYIGNDMLNDIYPAHKTGFMTALFAGDARSLRLREDRAECRNISPDIIVTDLKQAAV